MSSIKQNYIGGAWFNGFDCRRRTRSAHSCLQQGHIDPTLLTANARSYFKPLALADFRASLGPLGSPTSFMLLRTSLRGGLITREYDATCGLRKLRVIERSESGGLVEQFTVSAR